MRGSRGRTGGPDPPPLRNHTNKGFRRNIGPGPLTNTKLLYQANIQCRAIIGPPAKRHFNAILMALRWRADDGPLLVIFGSSFPS